MCMEVQDSSSAWVTLFRDALCLCSQQCFTSAVTAGRCVGWVMLHEGLRQEAVRDCSACTVR